MHTPLLVHAKRLIARLLRKQPILVNVLVDLLHQLRLSLRTRPSEMIKPDFEPLVRLGVQPMKLVAQLPRGHTLLERLRLRCRSVFVRSANVKRRDIARPRVSGVDVGGEGTADDIAEMGDIVDIGKRRGDEDVPLAPDREDGVGAGRRGLLHEQVRRGPDLLGVCHGCGVRGGGGLLTDPPCAQPFRPSRVVRRPKAGQGGTLDGSRGAFQREAPWRARPFLRALWRYRCK